MGSLVLQSVLYILGVGILFWRIFSPGSFFLDIIIFGYLDPEPNFCSKCSFPRKVGCCILSWTPLVLSVNLRHHCTIWPEIHNSWNRVFLVIMDKNKKKKETKTISWIPFSVYKLGQYIYFCYVALKIIILVISLQLFEMVLGR